MPKAGIEPARGHPHSPLKTACLPVPPLRRYKNKKEVIHLNPKLFLLDQEAHPVAGVGVRDYPQKLS